jgi:hypothetical protein
VQVDSHLQNQEQKIQEVRDTYQARLNNNEEEMEQVKAKYDEVIADSMMRFAP